MQCCYVLVANTLNCLITLGLGDNTLPNPNSYPVCPFGALFQGITRAEMATCPLSVGDQLMIRILSPSREIKICEKQERETFRTSNNFAVLIPCESNSYTHSLSLTHTHTHTHSPLTLLFKLYYGLVVCVQETHNSYLQLQWQQLQEGRDKKSLGRYTVIDTRQHTTMPPPPGQHTTNAPLPPNTLTHTLSLFLTHTHYKYYYAAAKQ